MMFFKRATQGVIFFVYSLHAALSTHQYQETVSLPSFILSGPEAEANFVDRSHIFIPSDPVVSTKLGNFKGSTHSNGQSVRFHQFLGIRYAEPPLGKLRFKNPTPWTGYKRGQTYKVTEFCPPCMQTEKDAMETSGMLPSEDCLCLNIYRPSDCNNSSKKPVLVYIFGGAFLYGSSSNPRCNGSYLAHYGDMIVVTINHRLGGLGWFYSGDGRIPGNMGYYDTVLAVKWVKQYIMDFGGDPDAITLAGFSSGAILVTKYLFDLELPQDLFRAVMIFSPIYNLREYIDPHMVGLRKSRNLAHLVGCSADQSIVGFDGLDEKVINCLESVYPWLLADLSKKIPQQDGNGICSLNQLGPVLYPGEESLEFRAKNGLFWKGKPIYYGGVSVETFRAFQGSLADTRSIAEGYIHREISPVIKDQSRSNIEAIIDWYLGRIDFSNSSQLRQLTTQVLDDVCVACPRINLIQAIKVFNPVYFYRYLYVTSHDRDSRLRKYGPIHDDDIFMYFADPLREIENHDDYDRAVSLEVISIFSDFVHARKMKWPAQDADSNPLAYLVGDGAANYYQKEPKVEICRRLAA